MTDLPLISYVRVSRKGDREDERFHSPREQDERARAHAASKGRAVGWTVEDIDVSGATHPAERPGMAEALELVRAKKAGGLVAFSLDRFSRDPAHGDWLVREVTSHGGIVSAPDMPDDITTPTGEFTFGMLLGVARLYRRTAGERLESAKARAIAAGIPVGSIPFGYRQKDDRTLEVDPALAPIVRELFERRANGEGYTPLAAFLTEATGHPWTRQGVAAVLRNRIYATGRLEYGDFVSEVDAGAIVDEPLWHAAQSTAPRRTSRSNGRWLLTGLVRCESCGNSMAPWTGARRRRQDPRRGKMGWVEVPNPPRRYRCRTASCPGPTSVDADRLERWVVLQSFDVGDELVTRSEAPDLGALEEAVEVAERRLAQVMAPEARDALGELWTADVKARRTERDEALAALGEARQVSGVASVEHRLRDVWDDLSPEDRRAAISLFWKAIRIGTKNEHGTPVTLVARGPHAQAEVELPENGRRAE